MTRRSADPSLLAVDLGKTGCRAALDHGGARHAASGSGTPGLAAADGAAVAAAAILAVAGPLLRAAGIAGVETVAVGAAGALAAPAAARELAARLCAAVPAQQAVVGSDALMWHAGALGGAPGIVLAAGTGAVAIGLAPDGAMRRADGSGPWLGDDGSGAWIGRQGLAAVLRAADGRGPATTLQRTAEAAFGPIAALPAAVEGHANPPRLLAGFAPSVADAAIAGDPVATDIMRRAGQALAATLLAAGRDLPQPAPFVLVGGLAALGAALLDPMRAALPPGVVEAPCRGDALDGARLLAARRDAAHERHVARHVAGRGSDMVAAERLVRQGDS